MQTIGHHTCLKDGGREFVENEAPFLAEYADHKGKLPFLGQGYYFWDNNLSASRWWGDNMKPYNGKYYIVESVLDIPAGTFFDLVGSRADMIYFVELMEKYRTQGRNKAWPIGAFIEFLKKLTRVLDPNVFPYKVIRAIDHNSPPDEQFFVPYVKGKNYYLNLSPKLVICLLEKTSLIILTKKIVHES